MNKYPLRIPDKLLKNDLLGVKQYKHIKAIKLTYLTLIKTV